MRTKVKILVTGAKGQLGSELQEVAKVEETFEWEFTDVEELDLSALDVLAARLSDIQPDIIINCAAYTAVDRAEDEVTLTDLLNHKSLGVLAEWTAANACKLIHISTDYVFDGTSKTALDETAPTAPINVYGATKLAGERLCFEKNPNAVIIRTSWVYSQFGHNFVKTMLRLMEEQTTISVVEDQVGSPTYAFDLAQTIYTIVTHPTWHSGVFNFSNEGEISWYAFAKSIKSIARLTCTVKGVPSTAYPTKAKRPKYSLLDKTKIKATYGVAVPHYLSSLEKCIRLLQK